ncbi:RING finger protein 212B-like [Engraulis encrasicolus]|uniref:RING finger protein 212B-like n=1 Tax=Engraulis encrasicolus TaxID=184585 RepID=UPI002FD09EF7
MRMDWFHCNRCFRKDGKKFAISSCGHIFCESCITPNVCGICGNSCSYLQICDQKMKPEEQVFFRDPVKLIQSRMEHMTQVAQFQLKQMNKSMMYHKKRSVELERRLNGLAEEYQRLKKENADLKKHMPVSRVSPGKHQSNGSIQKVCLPVAVTSPVNNHQQSGSLQGPYDSLQRLREMSRQSAQHTPPSNASAAPSLNLLYDRGMRTPTSLPLTPTRSDMTSPIFQLRLQSGFNRSSPRTWVNGQSHS